MLSAGHTRKQEVITVKTFNRKRLFRMAEMGKDYMR